MVKAEYKAENEGILQIFKRAGKALLFAVLFTVIVFAAFSLLLTMTGLTEKVVPAVVLITMVISVVIAGYTMTRPAKSKGFLKGAVCGLVYVVLLYIIAALISSDFSFNAYVLIMLAIGLFAGAFGGILGVNAGSKRR